LVVDGVLATDVLLLSRELRRPLSLSLSLSSSPSSFDAGALIASRAAPIPAAATGDGLAVGVPTVGVPAIALADDVAETVEEEEEEEEEEEA